MNTFNYTTRYDYAQLSDGTRKGIIYTSSPQSASNIEFKSDTEQDLIIQLARISAEEYKHMFYSHIINPPYPGNESETTSTSPSNQEDATPSESRSRTTTTKQSEERSASHKVQPSGSPTTEQTSSTPREIFKNVCASLITNQ